MKIRALAALLTCAFLAALPSGAEAPKGLAPADVAKNKALTETFSRSVVAKDWAAVAAIYAEDAVLNPPTSRPSRVVPRCGPGWRSCHP